MGISFANGADIQTLNSAINFGNALPRSTVGTKPYFLAQKDNGGAGYTTAGEVAWNSVVFNDGGAFNGTRFTAPVTGTYWFYCWIMSNNVIRNNLNYAIARNGSSTGDSAATTGRIYNTSSTAAHKQWCGGIVFRLNANDYVSVININLTMYFASIVYTKFSGILIG